MIKVIIQLNDKTLHTVEIFNDETGNERTGNYTVRLKSSTGIFMCAGKIKNFDRSLGSLALTRRAIESLDTPYLIYG